MKTSARFLAMLVAVLMIASAAITVSAFSDVEEGYEHATAIATLNQLGVIGGYEDGTFKPDANVERDEMAKLVYVLYTTFQDAGTNATSFKDVPASHWATGYVAWCSAMNIVGGFGDGTFKPDDNITYDQALKMVCATLGYTDFDSKLWPTDVRQKAITDLKLNTGLEKVNGSDKLTRGQVAQLLYNALDKDMAETKVVYTEITAIDGQKYKVPNEVAKTLAADVWGFEEVVIRVVATENLVFNAVNSATVTGDGEKIKAVVVEADGSLSSTTDEYELADLGLEAYKDNTDALIGLDIMTIEKGDETLAKATVLGSVKVVNVEVAARNSDYVPEVDQVKIDGVIYKDAKKTETPFTGLQNLTFSAGTVTTSGQFAVELLDTNSNSVDDTARLEYPHTALAIDSNGDGVYEAVAVSYYKPYVVTKVKDEKATADLAAHTVYTVDADLTATTGDTTIKSLNIADGKTLEKGDIFVAAKIADTWYIDTVVEATADAVATKITETAVTLKDIGEVKVGVVFNDVAKVTVDTDMLNDDADGNAKTAKYYLYNNTIIHKVSDYTETAESYNYAILLYVDEPGKGVVVNNTLQTEYPAVLLIDGKQTTVNLNASQAIKTAADTYVTAVDASASADYKCLTEEDGKTIKYQYKLVTYTVNKDGEYTLSTYNPDLGDTVVVEAGKEMTISTNTGLIDIDGNMVVLDGASVIYYTYNKESASDKFNYLGTYTSANILNNFDPVDTVDKTFLLDNEDGTYTLIATVIEEKLVAPNTPDARNYKNDARLIKYSVATSAAERADDGIAYYSYAWLDFATMKNGSLVLDTTKPATEATKAAEAMFYGWDSETEKYVVVNNAAVEDATIQIGTVAKVNTNLGIVFFEGDTEWNSGIKLSADVKIFGAANKNSGISYKTFDLAALAELLEDLKEYNIEQGNLDENGDPIEGKTPVAINCAIGTYVDEDTNRQIAWIIVDNWYDVQNSDGTTTFTKAYNIVGAID